MAVRQADDRTRSADAPSTSVLSHRHQIEIRIEYLACRIDARWIRNGDDGRVRATISRLVHIRRAPRDPRLSGRAAARFPPPPRSRYHLPRRRHRRRLAAARELVLA